MTNYEKLFQDQMTDPQFTKAYYEARIERMFNKLLEDLKKKISRNESKEVLLKSIDLMQKQIQ
jgi:hypothetical protein